MDIGGASRVAPQRKLRKPLQKTIGIDVHLDADRARRADLFEPLREDTLNAHAARRLDQKPAAVTAAQPCERRRRGSQHPDIVVARRDARQLPHQIVQRLLVRPAENKGGKPAVRWPPAFVTPVRLLLHEAVAGPFGERGDDRLFWIIRLQQHLAGLGIAARPPGHLVQQLKGPLGRPQVAAR